ncbi:hypothetical protein [Salinarimonas chemoclinalis]|uniref:hypothetical protein n=1 Tax=Salinarimonas chemoclinalis TaxID=3241599 RepID=UPI003557C6B7
MADLRHSEAPAGASGPTIPVYKTRAFESAKALSDFIAMHSRVQFLIIGALLMLAGFFTRLHDALRNEAPFTDVAPISDRIGFVVLLGAAIYMLMRTFGVFLAYLRTHRWMPRPATGRFAAIAGVFVLGAGGIVLAHGAIAYAAFIGFSEAFGLSADELPEMVRRFSERTGW